MNRLAQIRAGVWHFRHGGLKQFALWRQRQRAENFYASPATAQGAVGVWQGRGRRRHLSFAAVPWQQRPARRQDLRAAVILDDFSAQAFSYEWQCLAVEPAQWQSQLKPDQVDLLFVESAWAGNGGVWRGKVGGPNGPSQQLRELVQWCRAEGIPTVFWNKEDPPHFEDFLETARLFDVVFTSDEMCIPRYQAELGHQNVQVLPFAAQPAIHNPVRPREGWHSRDVAFAGMYFAHKYPRRREQMDVLLGGAEQATSKLQTGLEIFSRNLGGSSDYQFPEPYASRVVGSLTYPQMLTAYRSYKLFLNVNSVVDSPSMCARRIFEISASGTPVLSAPSQALRKFFTAEEVPDASTAPEAESAIRALVGNPELNDRTVHLAQRTIWSQHTYAHRAEQILGAAAPHSQRGVQRPSVSALVSTYREHQLDHVFATLASQHGVTPQLVLLTHGFELSPQRLDALQKHYGLDDVVALSADSSVPLGECLNRCVQAADGQVLSKIDDDDGYGPHYLSDLLYALDYSAANVVGKQAHYVHLESTGANVLRFGSREHRYTNFVMGPTLTARREVFQEHPFAPVGRGEDTKFLAEVSAAGVSIYAADRFNYVQRRRSEGHTWAIADAEILASGDLKFYGGLNDHCFI